MYKTCENLIQVAIVIGELQDIEYLQLADKRVFPDWVKLCVLHLKNIMQYVCFK